MSISINWKTATDVEKIACFAERVAKLTVEIIGPSRNGTMFVIEKENGAGVPDYLHSADAVLPWLEKQPSAEIYLGLDVHVILKSEPGYSSRPHLTVAEAVAPTLPEAAMIALLRTEGVEVITS